MWEKQMMQAMTRCHEALQQMRSSSLTGPLSTCDPYSVHVQVRVNFFGNRCEHAFVPKDQLVPFEVPSRHLCMLLPLMIER